MSIRAMEFRLPICFVMFDQPEQIRQRVECHENINNEKMSHLKIFSFYYVPKIF